MLLISENCVWQILSGDFDEVHKPQDKHKKSQSQNTETDSSESLLPITPKTSQLIPSPSGNEEIGVLELLKRLEEERRRFLIQIIPTGAGSLNASKTNTFHSPPHLPQIEPFVESSDQKF